MQWLDPGRKESQRADMGISESGFSSFILRGELLPKTLDLDSGSGDYGEKAT